jgi:CubicO group peptidase (beta-lactamase class C family)
MIDSTSFELGSISKVLVGVMLADAARRGEVSLEDPVAKYLPSDWSLPTFEGKPIRLIHLATHSTGLPLMPDNWRHGDYTREQLKAALAVAKLPFEPGRDYVYSNFGAALIALSLEARTGQSWGTLLAQRFFEPLGMTDSAYEDGERPYSGPRLQGYDDAGEPVPPRADHSPMGPCCAVRVTLRDVGRMMNAMLEPSSPLAAAFAEAQRQQHPAGLPYGLGWELERRRVGVISKTGRVAGFHTMLTLLPRARGGVFVVANSFQMSQHELEAPLVSALFSPPVVGAGAVHEAFVVEALPEAATRRVVTFDDKFRLEGYEAPAKVHRSEAAVLRFYYRCLARPDRDLQSFIHGDVLLAEGDTQPPAAVERTRLHADHFPGKGGDSVLNWRAGELVLDEVSVQVPEDYDAPRFQVWFGWYHRQRTRARGQGVAEDNRVLGPMIEVLPARQAR